MGGCTPAARTRPLVKRARTSGQRWAASRRAGAQILACLQPLKASWTWTQHAPLCASLSILRGPGLSHMRDGRGYLLAGPDGQETSRGAPCPRGSAEVHLRRGSALLPAALVFLPAATQRQSHDLWRRGAESARLRAEGVGEVTLPPTCCPGVSQGAAGLGGRPRDTGALQASATRSSSLLPVGALQEPRPGRVIGHPDGGICLP